MLSRFKLSLTVLILVLSLPMHVYGQTASSTNYKILSDSTTNCGGGYSSSTNYKLFDTLCETATANVSSTNYVVQAGFQAQKDIPNLTVSLSDTALTFGDLSTASVATDTITVTVTTNAENGYAATIVSDGAFRKSSEESATITAVADGTVSAGGNEYGFATSGTDGQFNATDTSVTTSPKTFASRTGWGSSVATVLTFKVGASAGNSSGAYTQSLTVIVTGTF